MCFQPPLFHDPLINEFIQRPLSVQKELFVIVVLHRREDSLEVTASFEFILYVSDDVVLVTSDFGGGCGTGGGPSQIRGHLPVVLPFALRWVSLHSEARSKILAGVGAGVLLINSDALAPLFLFLLLWRLRRQLIVRVGGGALRCLRRTFQSLRRVGRIHPIQFGVLLLGRAEFAVFKRLDAYEREQIANEIAFDFLIQRGVAAKGWTEIHLDEPALLKLIDENVEAKELKAVVGGGHVLLACLIDLWLPCDHRFDDDILDLLPNGHVIKSQTSH